MKSPCGDILYMRYEDKLCISTHKQEGSPWHRLSEDHFHRLTSGLRLDTRRTECIAVGAIPWSAILPVTADVGMAKGPRLPGIDCMDSPGETGRAVRGEQRDTSHTDTHPNNISVMLRSIQIQRKIKCYTKTDPYPCM